MWRQALYLSAFKSVVVVVCWVCNYKTFIWLRFPPSFCCLVLLHYARPTHHRLIVFSLPTLRNSSRKSHRGKVQLVLRWHVDQKSLFVNCRATFPVVHSSIVLIHSQPPVSFSFHRLTLLSPVLTARTLPLKLQLARQATASKLRVVCCQSPIEERAVLVEKRTPYTGGTAVSYRARGWS